MAAALKKLAVTVLTDKKLRKVVFGIVLGILIIILMPIAAVLALFNGTLEFDTARLQEMIVQNLTAEQKAQMQAVEETMYAIQDAMIVAGFPAGLWTPRCCLFWHCRIMPTSRTSYPAWWAVFRRTSPMSSSLQQSTAAFGTALSGEDFRKVMASVRGVNIDTSSDVDLSTKNNLDLAQWAIAAEKGRVGLCVWGTYGQVLDQALYAYKAGAVPGGRGGYAEFIEQHWVGQAVCRLYWPHQGLRLV